MSPRARRGIAAALASSVAAAGVAVVAYLTGHPLPPPGRSRTKVALIGWAFVFSFAASVGLMVTYALGGQTQIEGVLLMVALGGISIGLIAWSHRLMPQGPDVEERRFTFDDPQEEAQAEKALTSGAHEIGRRGFLGSLLAAALGALGLTALFPIRSLGQRPGGSLFRTSWRGGTRAVTQDGTPVLASALADSSVLTVFPEGHTDAADSQVVLIKMPAGSFTPKPGRETWSPRNIVGFSKICTHAGCPVGLYQAATRQLFCPCHQSVFDVPKAAAPTAGPATRALPQLPLAVDAAGYIVAQSDFTEPVGPEFWNFGAR